MLLLLSDGLLRARLRASLLPQGSVERKSPQIKSNMALTPTPALSLLTFPNEKKALKPVTVN